jgi:hypothetical protein
MTPRTRFLSRLIGLYSVLMSVSMAAHGQATVATVNAIMRDPAMLLLAGVIAVAAGLAIVLGHNVWSGGLLPVVVTLVGWASMLKGLLLLFVTPDAAAGFWGGLHYEQFFYVYMGISFVLGAYLTYGGFRRVAAGG